jgi:hypothetical protein
MRLEGVVWRVLVLVLVSAGVIVAASPNLWYLRPDGSTTDTDCGVYEDRACGDVAVVMSRLTSGDTISLLPPLSDNSSSAYFSFTLPTNISHQLPLSISFKSAEEGRWAQFNLSSASSSFAIVPLGLNLSFNGVIFTWSRDYPVFEVLGGDLTLRYFMPSICHSITVFFSVQIAVLQ